VARDDEDRVTAAVEALAAEWDRANGDEVFPAERLAALGQAGALSAFTTLPDIGAVRRLDPVLRRIGGADLSLGRLFEGHVNAAQLIEVYGDPGQRAVLADDLAAARIFGVWNTEPAPMTIEGGILHGAKSFATGAGHIDRALITARDQDGDKRMVLVDIAGLAERADNSGWQVRGMKGTQSGRFDFTGMPANIVGASGDYEREPRFSAGAWRFAAVQIGAAESLVRHWRAHLVETGKGDDPIQRLRFGQSVGAVRSAGLWVAQAAQAAEAGAANAIPLVLMARGLVEDAALQAMEGAARAVGTASFFAGSRIDRITRDLGLYLRQPVPDQARDRAAAAWLEHDQWGEDDWW